jgi:imidazolonepropionase-like amidohydrolase
MEALQAATCNPARYLGMLDKLGTVEKGKIADLVLLEANPLTEISNTQKIYAVVIGGKYIPKSDLQEMLKKVEDTASKL